MFFFTPCAFCWDAETTADKGVGLGGTAAMAGVKLEEETDDAKDSFPRGGLLEETEPASSALCCRISAAADFCTVSVESKLLLSSSL